THACPVHDAYYERSHATHFMRREFADVSADIQGALDVPTPLLLARIAEIGLDTHSDSIFFFFQAEDGIRDRNVTGVQTCALPIYGIQTVQHPPFRRHQRCGIRDRRGEHPELHQKGDDVPDITVEDRQRREPERREIGRASCRERGERWVGGGAVEGEERE